MGIFAFRCYGFDTLYLHDSSVPFFPPNWHSLITKSFQLQLYSTVYCFSSSFSQSIGKIGTAAKKKARQAWGLPGFWRSGWDLNPRANESHDGFRVHAVMTSSVPLRILFCCTIVAFRGGFVNSLLCKIGAFLRIWRRNFGGNRVGGAGERLRRGRGYGKIEAVLDGSARYDCNY